MRLNRAGAVVLSAAALMLLTAPAASAATVSDQASHPGWLSVVGAIGSVVGGFLGHL